MKNFTPVLLDGGREAEAIGLTVSGGRIVTIDLVLTRRTDEQLGSVRM